MGKWGQSAEIDALTSIFLAEPVGFEPTVGSTPTQLFESCTFGRSDTVPSSSVVQRRTQVAHRSVVSRASNENSARRALLTMRPRSTGSIHTTGNDTRLT